MGLRLRGSGRPNAELQVDYAPEEGKSPLRAVEAIQEVLSTYEPVGLAIRDGDELHASGAALEGTLRVEVLPGALEVWSPGPTS